MDAGALSSFKTQAIDLLLPHVVLEKDRVDLLVDAFYTTHNWVRFELDYGGQVRQFAGHCIDTLAALPQGNIYLVTLLITLKRRYGEPQVSQIDRLIDIVPVYCAQLPADTRPPVGLPSDKLAAVVNLLATRFNEDELRDLCLRLDVDYEDLPPGGKSNKARELVLALNRRGRMADLAAIVTRLRPDIVWPVPVGQPELRARPVVFLSYEDDDAAFARRLADGLARHGHAVDLARGAERGSDAWLTATAEALSNAYAVVLIAGERTADDRWTRLELLAALDKRKPIISLRLPGGQVPPFLPADPAPVEIGQAADGAWAALLPALSPPPGPPVAVSWVTETVASPQLRERMRALRYMDRLKLEELRHVANYTRLGGETQFRRTRGDRLDLPAVVVRPELIHWRRETDAPVEMRRFSDAVPELKDLGRAVVLGEPGAGKTTTLYKLAADLIDAALAGHAAPVPLLVRLGLWTDPDEPFDVFLRRSAGELGDGLDARLAGRRAALLLDGLNEIPAGQQADKYKKVDTFLAAHKQLTAIVTCREQDYPAERALRLNRVTIAPLDTVRIHEFIHNYLDALPGAGPDAADDLFRQLAGEEALRTYARFLDEAGPKLADPFRTFWLADELPEGISWGFIENWDWDGWRRRRANPAGLLLLAGNPYMLFMLLAVYRAEGHRLPPNRGGLFDSFVETLLVRERLFHRDPLIGAIDRLPEGLALLAALTGLAYAMQQRRAGGDDGGEALTALPLAEAVRFLDESQRRQAASANLLTPGAEVRFSHQLLQEYFVARAMDERVFRPAGGTPHLRAETIWPPDRWWQPTNWEEATILLAGLYSDDCTPVIERVADVNPEVAARCLVESGAAKPPDAYLVSLRERWLPRLTDLRRDPDARARAAVGRALGRVSLAGGTPLDTRPGVGFVVRDDVRIPDIAWGDTVPAGRYTVGGDKYAFQSFKKRTVTIDQPYRLSRYPVTYTQFDCFVRAADFADERWWADMPPEEEAYGRRYVLRELSEQSFPFANHPRERVSCFQAVAFGRWLSNKLGYTVDLPHEYEWEVAARYPDGRFYPWGETFDPARANTGEGDSIGRTSAVGIYPHGVNPALGLYDLSGNVWEWCRNKYDRPDDDAVDDSGARRVVRGGSWSNAQIDARAACRNSIHPFNRINTVGFRLVRRPPSRPL
jgi:formylglycine-generating enzyme required for sulfatase activity